MAQKTYKVTFPDGHVQSFSAPEGLSRDDSIDRAIQERSIAEGQTPDTFGKGVKQDLKKEGAAFTGALNPVSLVMGLPGVAKATIQDAMAEQAKRAQPFDQQAAAAKAAVLLGIQRHPAQPGQSGAMLGSLVMSALLGEAVPKVTGAVADLPAIKAAKAGTLELAPARLTKAAEAARAAYHSSNASTETLPLTGRAAERVITAEPGISPSIFSEAFEPNPRPFVGATSKPDVMSPRVVGKAPSLETIIDDMLNQVRGSGADPAELSTAPPSGIETTPMGRPPIGTQTPSTLPRASIFGRGEANPPATLEDMMNSMQVADEPGPNASGAPGGGSAEANSRNASMAKKGNKFAVYKNGRLVRFSTEDGALGLRKGEEFGILGKDGGFWSLDKAGR